LIHVAVSAVERSICFVGDFNADPDRTIHRVARRFGALREHGWKIPTPEGDWSFKNGTRIDHGLGEALKSHAPVFIKP
jgi:hypothetical protein